MGASLLAIAMGLCFAVLRKSLARAIVEAQPRVFRFDERAVAIAEFTLLVIGIGGVALGIATFVTSR